jgi:sporulation protein YlmC with PRC-barrel domain
MLIRAESFGLLSIAATDGTIGRVKDVYFDDDAWVIRYLVVTCDWFDSRDVLLSPHSITKADWTKEVLFATVTKDQVKNSPPIDTAKPISRQYEKSYLSYFGYAQYWGGSGLWGDFDSPDPTAMGEGSSVYRGHLAAPSAEDRNADPHLRSCNAVRGYHIHASDGEIGRVNGFLIDDVSWSIRYLIVSTGNWLDGHLVLISPEWIKDISWPQASVTVDLDRHQIKSAPVYDNDSTLDRSAEVNIYKHYGLQGYWQNTPEHAVS